MDFRKRKDGCPEKNSHGMKCQQLQQGVDACLESKFGRTVWICGGNLHHRLSVQRRCGSHSGSEEGSYRN